jgi:hypothetical protein
VAMDLAVQSGIHATEAPHQATHASLIIRRDVLCSGPVADPFDVLQDTIMTGDDLPAMARPDADAKPELRASDEDRDQAVERPSVLPLAMGGLARQSSTSV